jgi:SPP1 gp7 family putative phage head morphogenesis protein
MARSEAVVRRLHRALARRVALSERDLDHVVAEMYDAVRGLPRQRVVEVLREAAAAYSRQLTDEIRRGLREAARLGAEASRGALVAEVGAAGRGIVPAADGWEAAARWVELRKGPDRLVLSSRVHRQTARYRGEIDRVLAEALREGVGAEELARRLVDDYLIRSQPIQSRAVRDLTQAVRRMGAGGGDDAYAAASEAAEEVGKQIRRLVELPRARHAMRPATEHALERVVQAIEAGKDQVADRALRWLAHDQARYQQKVVARTEMQRAYARAFEQHAGQLPAVEGLIWNTARDAFVCEVCQERAGQTFPLDDLPEMPAHPQCRCYWTHAINRAELARQIVATALAA